MKVQDGKLVRGCRGECVISESLSFVIIPKTQTIFGNTKDFSYIVFGNTVLKTEFARQDSGFLGNSRALSSDCLLRYHLLFYFEMEVEIFMILTVFYIKNNK